LALANPSPQLGQQESALGPYLRAIRNHKRVVALIVLAAIVGAGAWLKLRTPDYEATAQMLVTPLPQGDTTFAGLQLLRDSGDPTRTVQTAAALVDSPQAADLAAQRLGGGLTGDDVLGTVSVQPQGQSNILAITAKATTAAEAQRRANAFTKGSLDVRRSTLRTQVRAQLTQLRAGGPTPATPGTGSSDQLTRAQVIAQLEAIQSGQDPTLSLAQNAVLPAAPAGASAPIILALAILAGLALGAGAALVLELTDRRIRDEDEVVALYPLPVLARVPPLARQRLRRGRDAVWYYIPPLIREAFRTLLVQLRTGKGHGTRSIMVTSASTGDGKTSSAINLAISLAAAGESVILLDLDMRKPDIARRLPTVEPTRLSSLLHDDVRLSELLLRPPGLPGLTALLPDARGADPALIESLYQRLPALLEQARELADYVVLDTAPLGEVSDALRIADTADDIIIAVRPGNTNRAHIESMRELLERLDQRPLGYLMVGWSTSPTTSAYGYGMQGRDLVASRPVQS
jgi:Mrp family chromosome partitioning ATPase/capsular polysaccharide biosynthesis protein